ncbi:MAG: VOC family protein [Bacteroidales bacterium]|nr:VOC family protein [Bacteroidales bacterium]
MKENYFISGIQQVGVGCLNFKETWKWYIRMFQMDVRVLEDDTVAERMLPYTGNMPQKRHACIALNLQGGGGFEIWNYSERQPVPCAFEVQVGDLGIFAAKIKSRDVEALHAELERKKNEDAANGVLWELGSIYQAPDGVKAFVVQDPWKNYFYVEERKDVYIEQHSLAGGITGAMVGCTDIDRSLALYHEVLGYDRVVYDKQGQFADLAGMKGGNQHYRRVKLACSKPRQGAFAPLLGESSLELVQPLDRTPRKIFEGRYWGDPGFIQICFDVTHMRALEQAFNEKGYHFTVDSCPQDEHFDMGEASGHFTYIEDPDGTLIELVEAHKITLLKKPHLYINMLKRNRGKAFPKVFFRLMGLNRVK